MTELAGPVEFLAVAFPLGASEKSVGLALRDIVASAQLEVVDVVAGSREPGGEIEFAEYFDARAALGLGDMDLSLRALVSDEDLAAVAGAIGEGERVVVLVIEHAWHRELIARAGMAGGRLVMDEWVEPDAYEAARQVGSAQVEGA